MSDQNVAEFVGKRADLINRFTRLANEVVADLKDLKYQVTQYDAKVQTFERQILDKKKDIADLEEQIRLKKIEVSGSFNNIRDSLTAREEALVKAQSELKVREENVRERAKAAEVLISKAEKSLGRPADPVAQRDEVKAIAAPAPAPAPIPVPAAAPAPAPVRRAGRPKKVKVPANA